MIYLMIIVSKIQRVISGHRNFSVSLSYDYHKSLSYPKIIIRCFFVIRPMDIVEIPTTNLP